MTRAFLVLVPRLALLGALCVACSAPPQGSIWFDGSSSETDEQPPFDPLRPGASIICDRIAGSGEPSTFVYVVSALNHKLAHYPDFAAAADLGVVSDCDGANRFVDAYSEYEREHPGFDADEPLGETTDEEPEAPPIEPQEETETSKIAGVPAISVNYPVVQFTYQTCKLNAKGNPSCSNADSSWIVHGRDLRNHQESCSGTFINKNWILTAAHCLLWPAIDQCMRQGIKRVDCKPDWDLYGTWRIQGRFRTGPGPDGIVPSADDPTDVIDRDFSARGYVMKQNWAGTDILKQEETCTTPNCFNPALIADHDLALIYLRPDYDSALPPRTEEDAAKRLSIVSPPDTANWRLAIAGWGGPWTGQAEHDPGARFVRQGTGPNGNLGMIATPIDHPRLDVTTTGAVFPCPGDSGGPVLRTGLNIQTNTGPRTNLEAIIAVMSTGSSSCNPVPPVGTQVIWRATRVDNQLHRDFISKTIHRWATVYKHFNGVPRAIGTPPPQLAGDEVIEWWGRSCTEPGGPPNGCAADGSEFCSGPGRLIARRAHTCGVCQNFTGSVGNLPNNQACNCIQGQCLPLSP